jgi:hypothetical protein
MNAERVHVPHIVREVRLLAAAPARAPQPPLSVVELPPAPAQLPSATEAGQKRIEALLQGLQTQLDELEARRSQSIRELQLVAVELAAAAAGQLLQQVITARDFPIERIVQAAIDRVGLVRPIAIRLHPDDVQLLQERLPALPDWKLEEECRLQPDPALRPGDCRADLPDGTSLLREAAAQLEEFRDVWLEELTDAQVERRSHATAGSGLKRFPDRRETA